MVDTTIIGSCPVCKGAIIADEPSVACDHYGRSTGDESENVFDGSPQPYVGHPGCVTQVPPEPEED